MKRELLIVQRKELEEAATEESKQGRDVFKKILKENYNAQKIRLEGKYIINYYKKIKNSILSQ